MVPLIDLVNHRSVDPNLRLGWQGEEFIEVNAGGHGAAAGDQLFFKYSDDDEPSSKFFKQFGFVDEHLPVGVKIQFNLRRHHPRYQEKRLMFEDGIVRAKLMWE